MLSTLYWLIRLHPLTLMQGGPNTPQRMTERILGPEKNIVGLTSIT